MSHLEKFDMQQAFIIMTKYKGTTSTTTSTINQVQGIENFIPIQICKSTRNASRLLIAIKHTIEFGMKEIWSLSVHQSCVLEHWPEGNSTNSLQSGWSWESNKILALLRTCLLIMTKSLD